MVSSPLTLNRCGAGQNGFASASVQDLADALGLLKGSVYYYIDSKEDLLYRLMEEIHDGIDELLREVQEDTELTAAEALKLYVKKTIAFSARNLKKITIYYHEIDQLSPAHRREILRRRQDHEDYVTELIRQQQEHGDVAADLDASLLSKFVFGSIVWMYRWYKPGRGLSVEQIADTCARFVHGGIITPSPAPNASDGR